MPLRGGQTFPYAHAASSLTAIGAPAASGAVIGCSGKCALFSSAAALLVLMPMWFVPIFAISVFKPLTVVSGIALHRRPAVWDLSSQKES